MSPKDIKHVHYLRFDEKLKLKDILALIKEDYKMSLSMNQICAHFNKHLNTTKQAYLKKGNKTCGGGLVDKRIAKVAEVISPMVAENVKIDSQLETAYSIMVQMTQDFASSLTKLDSFVEAKMQDEKAVKEALEGYNVIKLLSIRNKFHNDLGNQLKDINSLRAPKVLMVQFLEATIKKIVEEMSTVFTMLCSGIQDGITHSLRKEGAGNIVNDQLFSPTFQRVAQEYQAKMTEVFREQLFQARSALAELSKIQ